MKSGALAPRWWLNLTLEEAKPTTTKDTMDHEELQGFPSCNFMPFVVEGFLKRSRRLEGNLTCQ
jgi:hypothetical protein